MARKSPLVRKQELKLRSEKLKHQHQIADSRDKLRMVNEQLRALNPKPPRPQE